MGGGLPAVGAVVWIMRLGRNDDPEEEAEEEDEPGVVAAVKAGDVAPAVGDGAFPRAGGDNGDGDGDGSMCAGSTWMVGVPCTAK